VNLSDGGTEEEREREKGREGDLTAD